VAEVADEVGIIEETIVAADIAMIATVTIDEDVETTSVGAIGAVLWTTMTADVEMTFVVDAIDRHTGEALLDVVETIAVAVVPEVDRHHVAETIVETIEVVVTPEAHLEDAMMIVIGAVWRTIEMVVVVVVAMTMTSVVVRRICIVETIVEEMIAVIVTRGLVSASYWDRISYCCEVWVFLCIKYDSQRLSVGLLDQLLRM